MAEWDFQIFVLGTMFLPLYFGELHRLYFNEGEHAAGNKDFDSAKMPDAEADIAREGTGAGKGLLFILPSGIGLARSWADKDDNLNETLERVFNHIEIGSAASGDAENDFCGLFDDFDVNSKAIRETVAKRNKVLVELLNGVAPDACFSLTVLTPTCLVMPTNI